MGLINFLINALDLASARPVSPTNPLPVSAAPASAEYETVANNQANQPLGVAGAIGDRLDYLVVIPATTSPGAVVIKDGATVVATFAGGAASVSTLIPFVMPVGAASVVGAWNITTGANVSAYGVGNFT